MSNYVEQAVKRVEGYFKNYDTEQPAEILADILHYCREKGMDFANELVLAESYVDEELGYDDDDDDVLEYLSTL